MGPNAAESGHSSEDLPFEVLAEKPAPDAESASRVEDPGEPLEDMQLRWFESQLALVRQDQKERKRLLKLRTGHIRRLLYLAVIWVAVVWLLVLLQGFGQWFSPIPDGFAYLKFKLSDSVIIAFITSTTASVLGLYGIAAYWLYGKPKGEEKSQKPSSTEAKGEQQSKG